MRTGKGWIILLVGFVTLFILDTSSAVASSEYPNRPIEIICPTAPGGGLDFALNLFKNKVEKIMGQPIFLVHKPGAAGATGTVYAKGCKSDGYTLMGATISSLIIPPLSKRGAGYILDDFTAVCNLTAIPVVFCVKEDSSYKTMPDFIQAAKTKKMKYATPGAFTNVHILMEALGKEAGFQAIHIPHTGAAAGMAAVLGGHVDMLVAASAGFVGPGRLRIIATAEEKRLEDYPDVPTLKELGYPFIIESLDSLWAPKGVPKEIVDKLFQAHRKAFEENREEMTRLAKTGEQTVHILNGEELRKKYQYQSEFYRKILGEMGLLMK
jgi:tripartite-type tricarboxylate transporter receptor subunit TctC